MMQAIRNVVCFILDEEHTSDGSGKPTHGDGELVGAGSVVGLLSRGRLSSGGGGGRCRVGLAAGRTRLTASRCARSLSGRGTRGLRVGRRRRFSGGVSRAGGLARGRGVATSRVGASLAAQGRLNGADVAGDGRGVGDGGRNRDRDSGGARGLSRVGGALSRARGLAGRGSGGRDGGLLGGRGNTAVGGRGARGDRSRGGSCRVL